MMYNCFNSAKKSYSLLQDEKSKKVFYARFFYDLHPCEDTLALLSMQKERDIARDSLGRDLMRTVKAMSEMKKSGKTIAIYGVRTWGIKIANAAIENEVDFDCFISRGPQRFPNGFFGKPVYSPEWLCEHGDDAFLVVAASNENGSADQIKEYLSGIAFPEQNICKTTQNINAATLLWPEKRQYFEFPELYEEGTAFLDCGSLDGRNSKEFAAFCKGNYSKIFAFEPEAKDCDRIRESLKQARLHDVEVINAAVSNFDGAANFIVCDNPAGGCLSNETPDRVSETTEVTRVVTIDSIVRNEKVGFIKMDIEGSEHAALQGAAETIRRDKPLLAICVYHKPGDMLAIMDCCHQLVPEYRFWLRHYSSYHQETVLYASVRGNEN